VVMSPVGLGPESDHGNELNKPLHSNGHVPNITHEGGSHIIVQLYFSCVTAPSFNVWANPT
jgi:hypothetical protein